ncbi:MAG: type I glutamate--ammonia ligase [Fimbriimonas ginsengisoli]|uniref:Glutamine synthetase n=1 Tax=Fimbriimonas ginsengisoli TaxID=1005039 RepID=A0A931LX58_FIMGI|nr:type I glutamate--ammonia ligase [Fimbriimonas ginsengisoli]MBI3722008.1 type I glutamate--ammonia ligase [Fimbriimonas ginsengisoli]
MKAKEAVAFVNENDAKIIDIRFTDLMGTWEHFSIIPRDFDEAMIEEGLAFDGSSIRAFQSIDQSDMMLLPDPATMFMDPFTEVQTAVIICDVIDPQSRQRYSRDPRHVAYKAEEYLKKSGLGDTCYFGPEAEFFVFDRLLHESTPQSAFYRIESDEAHWESGREHNPGFTIRPKGGYFPVPPVDKLHDLRSEMVLNMEQMGVQVEMHHHEVGTAGQCEIDMRFDTLTAMADKLMKYKYVVKNTAYLHGMMATFMPKPLFGDNGSGMHVHMSVWKGGKNLMFDPKGYGGISDFARWYIGGVLRHAPALLAFCAPTTNSYRRLVPGYEAPINLVYSQRNRSACVRIPMLSKSEKAKRIEFRAPDPAANPYIAFAACLMAGLDGVRNKIEPPKPIDKDLYELPERERKRIQQTPGSLRATLAALQKDNKFLLEGGVFTPDLIEKYVEYKLEAECDAVDLRPHPHEFYLYADA